MTCHGNMIRAKYQGKKVHLYTKCGKIAKLDYDFGLVKVIKPGKRRAG